jgi:hypothetical protein
MPPYLWMCTSSALSTLQLLCILVQLPHKSYVGAHKSTFFPNSNEYFVRCLSLCGDEVHAYNSCAPTDAHRTVNLIRIHQFRQTKYDTLVGSLTMTHESGLSASALWMNDVVAGKCARIFSSGLSETGICNVRPAKGYVEAYSCSMTEIRWVIPRLEHWDPSWAVKMSVR